MALTKVQLPRTLRGIRFLEHIFYNRHPSLRRVAINHFVSLSVFANLVSLTPFKAKNFLILSPTIHGFEHLNQIFIHPDNVLKQVRRRAKREIINILKNQPMV